MKIIVDVMSGDNAPVEILKGAVMAAEELADHSFVLVGQRDRIESVASENSLDISKMEIVHADEIVTMEDDPITVVRAKKNSSMMTALTLLTEGKGDVVVSAGNTGALFSGASLIVRKMKGVQRAAIATVLPFKQPALLLDSGANLVINDEVMEQFAYMGSAYMKKMRSGGYTGVLMRISSSSFSTSSKAGFSAQMRRERALRRERRKRS